MVPADEGVGVENDLPYVCQRIHATPWLNGTLRGGVRGRVDGEVNIKGRALAGRTFYRDVALVRVYHIFHDFGSKPGPSFFLAHRARSKQAVPNFRRHASSRIDHFDMKGLILSVDFPANGNGSAGRYFSDGVVDQVIKGVEEASFVGLNGRKVFNAFVIE